VAYIIIGLNSEYVGINTYDVFVSECGTTNWQSVADDIVFSDFPLTVNLDDYSITGSCYQYYVSGDTGCYCSSTGSTIPPSPSVTPTPTPTPTPTGFTQQSLYNCDYNTWDEYILTGGTNAYHSLADVYLCNEINCNDFSAQGRLLQCGIYTPYSGLSTDIDSVILTPIYNSGGTQYDVSTFYTSVNDSCFSGSSFSEGASIYVLTTGDSNNYVYQILTGDSQNMFMKLHSIIDYNYDETPSTDTSVILGYDVQYSGSDWTINGQVSPDLTLRCGVDYHFHVCSTGETFYLSDEYNNSSELDPDGAAVLGTLDGVYNNGESTGTIIVNFSSSGITGGYWYGTGGETGASGRLIVNNC
jgi:hypothetical protein